MFIRAEKRLIHNLDFYGFFALEPIVAGTVMGINGGQVLLNVDDIPQEPGYAEMITEDLLLAPRDYQNMEDLWFTNHSCDSNMARLGGLVFIAKRFIAENEEITIDYAGLVTDPTWEMSCRCGSPQCRHQVTGNDWRNPKIAKALWQEWLPYIQKRIVALEILK